MSTETLQRRVLHLGDRHFVVDDNGFRVASVLYAHRGQSHEQIDAALRNALGADWDPSLLPRAAATSAGRWILGMEGDASATATPIRARLRLIGPATLERCCRLLSPLFSPAGLVVGVLLMLFAAPACWQLLRAAATTPVSAHEQLVAFAITLVGMLLHELGHATAARSRGVAVGEVGVGLYWGMPAFYADVTQVWSAPRATRVLTDVGGAYLQLLYAVGVIALAAVVDQPAFDRSAGTALLLTQIALLHTLNPGLKFDGYWLLTDLANTYNLHERTLDYWRAVLRRGPATARARGERLLHWLLPPLAALFIVSMLIALWTLAGSALLALLAGFAGNNWPDTGIAACLLLFATALGLMLIARLAHLAGRLFHRPVSDPA